MVLRDRGRSVPHLLVCWFMSGIVVEEGGSLLRNRHCRYIYLVGVIAEGRDYGGGRQEAVRSHSCSSCSCMPEPSRTCLLKVHLDCGQGCTTRFSRLCSVGMVSCSVAVIVMRRGETLGRSFEAPEKVQCKQIESMNKRKECGQDPKVRDSVRDEICASSFFQSEGDRSVKVLYDFLDPMSQDHEVWLWL